MSSRLRWREESRPTDFYDIIAALIAIPVAGSVVAAILALAYYLVQLGLHAGGC